MKKSRSQLAKMRRKSRDSFTDKLLKRIGRLQNHLYSIVLDTILNLETDKNGNIKFTQTNIRRAETGLRIKIQSFQKDSGLLSWVVNRMLEITDINKRYFSKVVTEKPLSIDEKAIRLVMRRWGYDVGSNRIIRSGYLAALQTDSGIAKDIATQIYQAIQAKTPLKDFQKQFKQKFTGGQNSLGMLERYYNQRTGDLFTQVDRQISKVYADELDLKYVIWNNDPKKTTTDFCRERAGNVYSVEEVNSWDSLKWKGKKLIGHNTLIDGHGYNCRTSIDYISKELAFHLRPELKTKK